MNRSVVFRNWVEISKSLLVSATQKYAYIGFLALSVIARARAEYEAWVPRLISHNEGGVALWEVRGLKRASRARMRV